MSTPLPTESPPAPAPPPDGASEVDIQNALRKAMMENDDLRASNQALHERVQRLVSRLQEAGSQLSPPGTRESAED